MKKILVLAITAFFLVNCSFAQTTWGNNNTRTETRDNASAYGTGVKSGFYETSLRCVDFAGQWSDLVKEIDSKIS